MSDKSILLIGGGGHCHSVLDSILSSGAYKQIGIVARDKKNLDELKQDAQISKYLIGTDEELLNLYEKGWMKAMVTLGSIGDPGVRIRIAKALRVIGFELPVIIDPSAAVSKNAKIAEGTYIGKNSVVNAGAMIGENTIINSGSTVEHDCRIGDFAHISSGTVLCGEVNIGENTHIGAGSVVRQQILIGKNVLIGIGSVVVRDLPDGVKAYGNPCKVVEV